MNKNRRKRLEKVQRLLEEIQVTLEEVKDEESEAYENLPDSLKESERGEQMSTYVDALESAYNSVTEALESVGEVFE